MFEKRVKNLRNGSKSSFHWSAVVRPVAICAITLSLQGVMIQGYSPSCLAAGAEWKTYYDQGDDALSDQRPVDAERYFRKALSLIPAGSEDNERCLGKLAEALTLRNQPVEARDIYQRMLNMQTKKYGTNSKKLVPALMALGSIQESLGDHTTATSFYQRALKINQKDLGPYSPEFAENLHALGRANARAGRRNEAMKQYKQSIAILLKEPSLKASDQLQSVMRDYTDMIQKNDDSDKSLINDFKDDILDPSAKAPSAAPRPSRPNKTSSKTAGTRAVSAATPVAPAPEALNSGGAKSNDLALSQSPSLPRLSGTPSQRDVSGTGGGSAWQTQTETQGNASREAQSNSDANIALRGLEQPWSANSLSPAYRALNDSIVDRNRYDQGEDYYKRMIATDLDSLGPHHPSVANDLNGLAQFYIKRQDYAQAEPLLTRAYGIYQDTYGLGNLLTINTCAALALVKFHLGQVDKASELYRLALNHCQSALGPNNIETARILNELAYLYFHQGKLQESRTMYGWALSSTEAAVGQQSPLLAACLKDYAAVLRSLGQTNEATNLEGRAASILADSPHL